MKVTAYTLPYSEIHSRYTAYYRVGLAEFAARTGGSYSEYSLSRHPTVLRCLRQARDSYRIGRALGPLKPLCQRMLDGLAISIGGGTARDLEPASEIIGKFLITTSDGSVRKICVDVHDSGEISSPEALSWSDIYFKTSYLQQREYPTKVFPLYQASFLLIGRLALLRSLREVKKTYDLCFTTRVWGGTNDVEGIEHNLRLLESLAKARCTKYLRAYLIAGDKHAYAKRLDRSGIPWSYEPLPLANHLDVLASSKLNIHRLGMHNSITWRMSELLCMGACPVLDQHPHTVWPEQLHANVHYLTLDAAPPSGRFVALDEQYEAIPDRIAQFITQPQLLACIGKTNQGYFDQFLEPAAVGQYICSQSATLPPKD